MARQDAGRFVARAGATGGGRTYRARVPYRWYSGLALIVVVGVFLVVYSRYENLHPPVAPAAVAPTTSDHWVAGLDFDLCGTSQQVLAVSPNATTGDLGLYSSGSGVLQIAPKTAADSGVNATVGRFSAQYPGLILTADSIGLPKKKVTYKNGTACPQGTPDAGKTGVLSAYIYPTATSTSPTQQSGDVRQVRFTQNLQIVTLAFVPSGATVPAPSQAIKDAVLDAEAEVQAESTTTTTAVTTAPTATTSKTSTSTTSKSSTTSTTSSTSHTTTTTTTAASTTSTTK
jgi:hypothetical protein